MKKNFKNGISIIEILIVLSVVALLAAITIPQFSKIRESQVIKSAGVDIISTLNKARSQTLASVNSSEYGVHFQSDRVIIFKGKNFSAGTSTNETILINNPAVISNVTLGGMSGTSGDVYFNRLYGVPSSTGTITITTPSNSKTITISATGSFGLN